MNWRELNSVLVGRSERQVLALLNKELAGERRMSLLVRMHQRYSVLRTARERARLVGKAKAL